MRILLAIAVALALLAPAAPAVAVEPAPAVATYRVPRRCAYKSEYNKVTRGMTRARVAIILHSPGTTLYYHAIPRLPYWVTYRTQRYRVCGRTTGGIIVQYVNERVIAKRW